MVQVGEALDRVLARAEPLGTETVELTAARGRILAQDIAADDDLPALPRSSVGGNAVVMVEEVDEIDGRAILQHRPRPGENVHPPGMDLARGQSVLCRGTRI